MAKWGEGDPRWVVQNRDDGRNINGWHWEEKNMLPWTKQRLTELFKNVSADHLDASQGALGIVCVKTITGDAALTTRKGNKRFAVYDLQLTLSWEAELTGSDKVKGDMVIEEFTSTVDPDEYILTVSTEKTGALQDQCKKLAQGMRHKVIALLQQFAAEFGAQ